MATKNGRRWWAAAVAAGLLMGTVGTREVAAQPERYLDTPTGWAYLYGASEATIEAQLSNGMRPFSINRVGANSFDTLFVSNSGSYAASGSDLRRSYTSAATLNSYLSANNKRIIDMECYDSAGTIGMDVLLVSNSGSTAAAGWSWGTFPSLQAIIDWQSATGLRPIDVDSFLIGTTRYYSCVAVPNTGANAQSWWWGLNATPGNIDDLIASTDGRVIDVDVMVQADGLVRLNALIVGQDPGEADFDYALRIDQVEPFHANVGGRLTILERFQSGGSGVTSYATAYVGNTNTEERRIRDLIRDNAASGVIGFSRKRLGGNFELAFNAGHEFEPASTMKIVHAAYAFDRMAAGIGGLTTNIYCADNCDINNVDCPDTSPGCNSGNRTQSNLIFRMMTNSDNNATNAIEDYYGRANLNNWLAGMGLGIRINHTLGCLCGETHNEMSSYDAALLYERIFDESLFGSTTNLKNHMFHLTGNGINGWLRQMLDQERALTGLTDGEYGNFRANFEFAWKDGGYGCDGINWGGAAGWAQVPLRTTVAGQAVTYYQEYSFAMLFDEMYPSQTDTVYAAFYRELLREPVRAALASWDANCAPPEVTSSPVPQSVPVGGSATFSASTAAGPVGSNYALEWEKSTNGGSTWTDVVNAVGHISGATTNTLTISNVVTGDAGLYRLHMSSNCGFDNSSSAQLTVTAACTAPTITTQPINETITVREDAVFTITAGGSSSGRTYMWQRAPSGGIYSDLSGVSGYSGATTATLSIVAATDANEGTFRCRVTNACGQVNSAGATLTVEPACVAPGITGQPASTTVQEGGEAAFSITANGSATGRTYQWQKRGNLSLWSNVATERGRVGGTTTATLTFFEAAAGDEGAYRCVVTNSCGTATSATVNLTVTAPPPLCGTSDFNGDGDVGTDLDIEAFFACLAGHCCASCWPGGSDFNGDGDSGTDLDIESFFRVLGGGSC